MSKTREELELLAMAYLTGQPTPEETRRFEELIGTDSDFAALVREIETFLAPLNEDVEPREPPPGLFEDILLEIEEPAPRATTLSTSSQGPWRMLALAASAIAVVSTALHFIPTTLALEPRADSQPLMAVMADSTAPEIVVIVYDARERRVLARLSNTELPDDGVWQLWLIRNGEEAPRSLGLLNAAQTNGTYAIDLLEELAAGSDTLAVSLEPAGGSPGPGPTGPILYTGAVSEIEL